MTKKNVKIMYVQLVSLYNFLREKESATTTSTIALVSCSMLREKKLQVHLLVAISPLYSLQLTLV